MSEDLKSKVIETIDGLIPKGQNSLGLREADVVYGINKAKEAVGKLFTEISTQDCISRQAAIDAIDEIEAEVADGDGFQYEKWRQFFCDLPSAEPERKKGTWEVCDILDYAQRPTGRKLGECSVCGYLTDDFRTMIEANKELTNYCPNCGAEMKGEADD